MSLSLIIFFYTLSSSSVLIYGVGIKQSFFLPDNLRVTAVQGGKMLLLVVISCTVLWPLIRFCMVPYRLADLYPFICIFVVVACAKLLDTLFAFGIDCPPAEIVFALGVVILSINESFTFVNSIITAVSCCLSFFVISVLLYAIKKRLNYANPLKYFSEGPLLFISMGLLSLVFYAWNTSWWNGVAG